MRPFITCTLALAGIVLWLDVGEAADPAGGSTIAYRLRQTKTLHFDDQATANQHYATVQQLGCEVSRDSHAGHTDVSYRSTQWKQMTVATEQLAHRWESWLQSAGFETVHGHAEADGHDHAHDHQHSAGDAHDHAHGGEEAVSYRLPRWTAQRFERESDREQFVAVAQALGCEVRQDASGVSIRCPNWKHAEFPSHAVAHEWEQWLSKLGFETRHSH